MEVMYIAGNVNPTFFFVNTLFLYNSKIYEKKDCFILLVYVFIWIGGGGDYNLFENLMAALKNLKIKSTFIFLECWRL